MEMNLEVSGNPNKDLTRFDEEYFLPKIPVDQNKHLLSIVKICRRYFKRNLREFAKYLHYIMSSITQRSAKLLSFHHLISCVLNHSVALHLSLKSSKWVKPSPVIQSDFYIIISKENEHGWNPVKKSFRHQESRQNYTRYLLGYEMFWFA